MENYIKLPSCIMVIRRDKKPLYMNIYIYTDYRLCIRNVYIERAPATVEQFDLRQVHPPKASTREPQTTRPKAAFNRNSSSHRRSYEGLSPKSSKIQKMTTGDNGIVPIFIHNKRFFCPGRHVCYTNGYRSFMVFPVCTARDSSRGACLFFELKAQSAGPPVPSVAPFWASLDFEVYFLNQRCNIYI